MSLLGLASNTTGETYNISKMYVETVHSLCQEILKDRAFSPHRSRKDLPTILDALDQYSLVYSNRFWRRAAESLKIEDDLNDLFADLNSYLNGSRHPSKHKVVTRSHLKNA